MIGHDVAFGYDGRKIVHGSFTLQPGEAVALLAPSGGGKTTLLKGLVGLIKPMEGHLTGVGEWHQVGMVFQNPDDQLFSLTVAEEIAFGLENLGVPAELRPRRIEQSLVQVGLAGFADRPLGSLSFGERKRVCMASIVAMRPRVLLLDEPSAGLDPQSEARMTDVLLDLKAGGISVLAATHAVDWIPQWADRLLVIDDGRIRELPVEDLTQSLPGLRPPYVTQLWQGLSLPHPPLTVETGIKRGMELGLHPADPASARMPIE